MSTSTCLNASGCCQVIGLLDICVVEQVCLIKCPVWRRNVMKIIIMHHYHRYTYEMSILFLRGCWKTTGNLLCNLFEVVCENINMLHSYGITITGSICEMQFYHTSTGNTRPNMSIILQPSHRRSCLLIRFVAPLV